MNNKTLWILNKDDLFNKLFTLCLFQKGSHSVSDPSLQNGKDTKEIKNIFTAVRVVSSLCLLLIIKYDTIVWKDWQLLKLG